MNQTGGTVNGDGRKLNIRWLAVPVQGVAVLITNLQDSRPHMTIFNEEIGVPQAAELLGKTKRRVQEMCDQGVLREGADWRKCAALGPSGRYLIKLASVMRLRGGETDFNR